MGRRDKAKIKVIWTLALPTPPLRTMLNAPVLELLAKQEEGKETTQASQRPQALQPSSQPLAPLSLQAPAAQPPLLGWDFCTCFPQPRTFQHSAFAYVAGTASSSPIPVLQYPLAMLAEHTHPENYISQTPLQLDVTM